MHLFTLVVIGLACLAFKSTRWIGVAGLTFLSLVFPFLFIALLCLGGLVYFYIYRSNQNEPPGLPHLRR